jgi:predicted nucleotidyltransferase
MGLIRDLEKLFGRRVDVLTPEGLNSIRVPSVGESIRKSLAYV